MRLSFDHLLKLQFIAGGGRGTGIFFFSAVCGFFREKKLMLCPECRVCGSSQLLTSHAQLHAQSCHAQLSRIFFCHFCLSLRIITILCGPASCSICAIPLCPAVGLTTVPFPCEFFLTSSNLNLEIWGAKNVVHLHQSYGLNCQVFPLNLLRPFT